MSDTWLYDEHPAMFRAHPLLFILLLVSVVGIVAIAIWWVLHKGERLALSDREVLMEKGLLSKQRTEIALSSIRSVRMSNCSAPATMLKSRSRTCRGPIAFAPLRRRVTWICCRSDRLFRAAP